MMLYDSEGRLNRRNVYAGHFYLTELLIPALLAGKETSPDGYARVITTSSSASYGFTIDWDTFTDGPARRKLKTQTLYFQSKFVSLAPIFQSRVSSVQSLRQILLLLAKLLKDTEIKEFFQYLVILASVFIPHVACRRTPIVIPRQLEN